MGKENKHNITVKEFLDAIHGANSLIYFNVGNLTWKYKPQTFSEAEPKLKMLNSKRNKDICYIVNSGGTTDSFITQINAAFSDWDCGKDEAGNYLDLDIVADKKQDFLRKIKDLTLYPNLIVETRNGYQTYWLLLPGATKEQFTNIQKRIAYYFKSDPSVCNPCRVMRLPDFYWVKPSKKCDPFLVKVISYTPVKYDISSLFNFFPYVSNEDYKSYQDELRVKQSKRKDRISAQDNSFSYYIDNTCDIYLGTYRQNEYGSVIDILKKQNLSEYLNTGFTGEITPEHSAIVKCPFHDDKTPSASIFIDKDTGFYRLYCHSYDCGFSGSILDVVMKQNNIDISEAIKILIEHYKLTEDEKWITDQKQIISQNIKIIERIDEFKDKYPDLCRVIHRIKEDLLSKLRFACSIIRLKTSRNQNIIIASLSKFQQLAYKFSKIGDIGRQNERIDRYCLLGLLRKLSDDEIPNSLMSNAYEQRDRISENYETVKGKRRNINRTQFYNIPEYTDEVLKEADRIALVVKEKGIRLNAISRDLVLQTLGLEKAQSMYPQSQTDEISKSGKALIVEIEKILTEKLSNQGFCTVSYIIEVLGQKIGWKSITDRRVKKYIPSLLVKHGLIEITANKELKQKLNITGIGYPKLIVKKNILEERKSYSHIVRAFQFTTDGLPDRFSYKSSKIRIPNFGYWGYSEAG